MTQLCHYGCAAKGNAISMPKRHLPCTLTAALVTGAKLWNPPWVDGYRKCGLCTQRNINQPQKERNSVIPSDKDGTGEVNEVSQAQEGKKTSQVLTFRWELNS